MSDEEKFETWKRRADAIVELREGQEEIGDNNDSNVSKKWEDWIVDSDDSLDELRVETAGLEGSDDKSELDQLTVPEMGLVKMVRVMVLGVEEEDILYEGTVFTHLQNLQILLAVLILIPWAMYFKLMSFLDRYVKTVLLAA